MEFIANETLRTAMENSPVFVENLNRRCSFSIDATASSSSGVIGCTIKHGNLFQRISCSRSTCNDSTKSTAPTTPMSTPNSSQPNSSRPPSPAFPSIPELSVVDNWLTDPIPSTTYYPSLKYDLMTSSSQPMERVTTSRDQSFP